MNKKIVNFIKENGPFVNQSDCQQDLKSFLYEIDTLWRVFRSLGPKFKFYKREQNRLYQSLNTFFKKAEDFEKDVEDKFLVRKVKTLFRNVIKSYLLKSKLLKHGYLKPMGYPGDFCIIEAMYNNKAFSSGIGHVLDKYFLNNDYVNAVRNRKNSMKFILEKYLNSGKYPINILNLACGSCREIRELLENKIRVDREINFILVDQDINCLKFAQKKLKKHPRNIKFIFIQADIMDFLRKPEIFPKAMFGKQHLIYSIGLADYLPNSILGPLFKRSVGFLVKNGHLIVAHKNTRIHASPVSDWGADWKFIPRDKEDLRRIITDNVDMTSYTLDFFFRKNQLIFYSDLKRRK